MSILPHEAKALKHYWSYFAFSQIWLVKIYYFMWADQDWIGLMIFKNFADQGWIGFNYIESGLDSDW